MLAMISRDILQFPSTSLHLHMSVALKEGSHFLFVTPLHSTLVIIPTMKAITTFVTTCPCTWPIRLHYYRQAPLPISRKSGDDGPKN